MIVESVLKKLVPLFLALVFASPVYSQRPSRSGGDSSSSNTTSNSGSSSNSSGGSSSSSSSSNNSSRNERSARPVNTRPTRPTESGNGDSHHSGSQHASSSRNEHHGHHNSYSSHHDDHHHHHHHGHSSGTVVVVEEPVYYTSSYAEPAAPVASVDIDKFMLFVNATGILSFRGFDEEIEYEDNEVANECTGYNFEARADVGLAKRIFLSSGIGFSRHKFSNYFMEGNYMVNTKRFLDVPLQIGYRNSYDSDFFTSIAIGPRFAYGLSGKCKESYDFYPDPEYGFFEHNSYGGKYGVDRFAVGIGCEANMVIYRFLIGLGVSLYPNNDCKPEELYEGLYGRFYKCRTNISLKVGWRVF